MPNLLNRIEREYVIGNLADTRPGLVLLRSERFFSVLAESYLVADEKIALDSSHGISVASGTRLTVHFAHRGRSLFFETSVVPGAGEKWSLAIPQEIFKADDEGRTDPVCRLHILLSDPPWEMQDSGLYPVDAVFIDPSRFERLQRKALDLLPVLGLSAAEWKNTLLTYRLAEFSEGEEFRTAYAQKNHFLFYIDSRIVLLASPVGVFDRMRASDSLPVVLQYASRRIECPAKLAGKHQLDGDTVIIAVDVSAMQIEDKRFLHERLFRTLYQG
jgi:hypothetical protein